MNPEPSPKPKVQSPKSSRHFVVEMIARLVARVSAAVRVLSAAWEHRTSNTELRTSKEDSAAGFDKSGERNLVHPLLPEAGLELPGKQRKKFSGDEGQRYPK